MPWNPTNQPTNKNFIVTKLENGISNNYLLFKILSLNYYHYYHYYLLIRFFHISVSWWSFTGDWVTAILLKSPVFWPFSIMQLFSWSPLGTKSSRPFNNPLVTVLKAPITIGIIVTFMFHSFFNSLVRSSHLFLFSHTFSFILWSAGIAKSTILQIFFLFLLIIIRSGLLAEIKWSICMSKSHRSLCVSFSRTGAGLCIHHMIAWSNLNLLHISQWITLPTQSCLALYSFCASLLHSLIIIMVSSLSPQSLHLLFSGVLSILALI